jgi:hypothetical protein
VIGEAAFEFVLEQLGSFCISQDNFIADYTNCLSAVTTLAVDISKECLTVIAADETLLAISMMLPYG